MKRLMVWVVIGSLLSSGTAWAQVGLTPCEKPDDVSWRDWNGFSQEDKLKICAGSVMTEAQTTPIQPMKLKPYTYSTGEPVSRGLAIAGIFTMIGGAALIFGHGNTYHILGDAYCVDTYSVDYGSCGPTALEAQIGLIAIGSGVLMTWIGLRDKTITVHPTVSPNVMGGSATIRW